MSAGELEGRETAPAPTERAFTRREVAELTVLGKLVLIILDNVVYNVTALVQEHPGGESLIIEFAGRDATAGFEGVGHSKAARKWKDTLRIGTLVPSDCA